MPTFRIPIARSGNLSDDALERIIAIGLAAQEGHMDEGGGTLLLMTAPQIATELLHRRRAMSVIEDMTNIENVRFLPAG